MAIISEFLMAIKNAVYGEEVRNAIHGSIKAINDQVEEVKDVRTEFASDLATCNEKAAIVTTAASAVQNVSDSVLAIIGARTVEYNGAIIDDGSNVSTKYSFSHERDPLYFDGYEFHYLDAPASVNYFKLKTNSKTSKDMTDIEGETVENPDYIREHKDSWYCCQTYYRLIPTSDGNSFISTKFNQLVVENCINLTEDANATLFDDTYRLPAVIDTMTRYYLHIPESAESETCTVFVCNAFSDDSTHVIAKLLLNKDSRILSAINWRSAHDYERKEMMYLTPMISFQNAIIDLQSYTNQNS